MCLLCFSTAQRFQQQNERRSSPPTPTTWLGRTRGAGGAPPAAMRMYGSFSRVVSGVPFWLCQGKQGLEEATRPPQHPPCPAAHLRLHPGRLEHEQLNGYRRKKEEVWPQAPAPRDARLRAPEVTAKGSTGTHLHPRAPGQPAPGTELSSPQTRTAHSQRGGPLQRRERRASAGPGTDDHPLV